MKKIAVLLLAFLLAAALPVEAGTRSSLEANRKLLARLERQRYELSKKNKLSTSPAIRQKLEKTNSLIALVKDERDKLYGKLPSGDKAEEFLKDTLAKKSLYRLQQSIEKTKTNTVVLHNKALKLTEEKKYDEAIRMYQEILLLDPHDDQAYLIMGHLNLLSFKIQEAEQAFFNAVDIDVDNRDNIVPFYQNLVLQEPSDFHYTCLGFACLIVGDELAAKNAFEEALEINPMNARAGNALMQLKA